MNRITIELEEALPEGVLRSFGAAVGVVAFERYGPSASVAVVFESPRRPEFGDFATNVAFSLAKIARRSPQAVAEEIIADREDRF